ncbi:MAG TPA: choice-of-anchor Q domain-containing protein, partial [Lentisphaeria bacterium]|nr:choice-of-anchor Q domain-containing protein [Lentisphaeria bacterium]
PMFVDAANGDYSLSSGSPCINSGSNEFVRCETDRAGNPRIRDEVVDMGAFESTGTPVLPEFKYDWQSGWNTLYLPFDSLDPATAEALAKMPVFRLYANANVKDKPVSLHTPLWIFCADPKLAPVLRGTLTQDDPPDPLDIPVGQWVPVGAQCLVETLPDEYAAWEWRDGRYARVQSLQAGRVYFIYRSNTP